MYHEISIVNLSNRGHSVHIHSMCIATYIPFGDMPAILLYLCNLPDNDKKMSNLVILYRCLLLNFIDTFSYSRVHVYGLIEPSDPVLLLLL